MRKPLLLLLFAFGAGCTGMDPDQGIGVARMPLATDPQRFGMIFMVNDGYGAEEIDRLADIASANGVKWMIFDVRWSVAEPHAPQATPSPGAVFGPRLGYHSYDFSSTDRWIYAATSRGINVVIRFYVHPTWAGGQSCAGFLDPACGIIRTTHRQTFADGLHDLAYHTAARYPDVRHYAVWNEPNLPGFFSPEPPLAGGLIGEYVNHVAVPASTGIRAANPSALIVGPDLFTCEHGDTDCVQENPNWNYSTRWILWVDSLAAYTPNLFDVYTFHNYGDDERGAVRAATDMGTRLAQRGLSKPMWLTEFNFRDGTCGQPESSIAAWTFALYRDMNWQRSFFNALLDSDPTCGFGLVHSPGHPWARLAPKSTLYPRFRSIVNGTYPNASSLAEIENTTVTHYTDESGNPPPLSRDERVLLHGQPFGSVATLEAEGVFGLLTPEFVNDTQLRLPLSALGGSRRVRVQRRFAFPTGVEVRANSRWVDLSVIEPTCTGCQVLNASGTACVNLPAGSEGNCPTCQDCDGNGSCTFVALGNQDVGCSAGSGFCSAADYCDGAGVCSPNDVYPCCGDGYCDFSAGEDCSSCSSDCGVCAVCGDGSCNGDEDCNSCPQDCCILQ